MRPVLLLPALAWRSPVAVFQQIDVDYTMGEPLRGMPGSTVGPVPIIRMFGVTQEVRSRCMGAFAMRGGSAAARSAERDSPPPGMERGGMDPWLCPVFLLSCPVSLQCLRL